MPILKLDSIGQNLSELCLTWSELCLKYTLVPLNAPHPSPLRRCCNLVATWLQPGGYLGATSWACVFLLVALAKVRLHLLLLACYW